MRDASWGGITIKTLDLVKAAQKALEDKKGENIAVLDVRKLSSVTDYYIIVSGTSAPHLKAMFGEVQHALKEEGVHCYKRSGEPESGWLVLDYVDVIIHIFLPATRQYYAVEELWENAKRPIPRRRKSKTKGS